MRKKMTYEEWKKQLKFVGEYEGKAPIIVDEPFDPAMLDNETPLGLRWGGDVITLKPEHIEALRNGQYIAIDVEKEYVAFLKFEDGGEKDKQ